MGRMYSIRWGMTHSECQRRMLLRKKAGILMMSHIATSLAFVLTRKDGLLIRLEEIPGDIGCGLLPLEPGDVPNAQ